MITNLLADPLRDWRALNEAIEKIRSLIVQLKSDKLISFEANDASIFLEGALHELEDARKRLRSETGVWDAR